MIDDTFFELVAKKLGLFYLIEKLTEWLNK